MKTTHFNYLARAITICCIVLLFIALFPLPTPYFWGLRTVVFVGAVLVLLQHFNTPLWVVLFTTVAILFNPIFPIYLYTKDYWVPIDILTGLLFLTNLILYWPKNIKKPDPRIK